MVLAHRQMIPLHLTLASAGWMTSLAALSGLSRASLYWNPSLSGRESGVPPEFLSLCRKIAENPALEAEVRREINARMRDLLAGVRESLRLPTYRRLLPDAPVVWRRGSCALREYSPAGKPGAPALLLVPSLINRYYVLDLTREVSLARWLAAEGFAVYLADWGEPGDAERYFDCGDYVTRYLCEMAEAVRARLPGTELAAVGHCMGGMLALALACLRPDLVDRLVLLAAPWDFAPHLPKRQEALRRIREAVAESLAGEAFLPADRVLALFYLRDPWLFEKKIARFRRLRGDAAAFAHFLAFDDWAENGVPLAAGVARNCFLDWGLDNATAQGRWRVGGRIVDPARVPQPALAVLPRRDRIVPDASSRPLFHLLPNADLLEPASGHAGMVAGPQARPLLWEPMRDWLSA